MFEIQKKLDDINNMIIEIRRELNPDIAEPEDLIYLDIELGKIHNQMQAVRWMALGF